MQSHGPDPSDDSHGFGTNVAPGDDVSGLIRFPSPTRAGHRPSAPVTVRFGLASPVPPTLDRGQQSEGEVVTVLVVLPAPVGDEDLTSYNARREQL